MANPFAPIFAILDRRVQALRQRMKADRSWIRSEQKELIQKEESETAEEIRRKIDSKN